MSALFILCVVNFIDDKYKFIVGLKMAENIK